MDKHSRKDDSSRKGIDKSPHRSSRHIKKKKSRDQKADKDRRVSKKRKKEKSSKRSRKSSSDDSSSTSSCSSRDEKELLSRLHSHREHLLKQRNKQKEIMKANETPAEKRLRRLLKKESKERRRKERMGWDKEYLHYTNSDNPFGDSNILSTFVWSKKLAAQGLSGLSHDEVERINRAKQIENSVELEKVKGRRMEREREREAREAAMAGLQREREAAQFDSWQRQEDQFHLDQARLRSNIRIADGRAKPIDLLAKYINSEEEVDTVEMHEPYTYLNGLTLNDLEDLIEDIKVYMELERGRNLDYWQDITVIVEDELYRLRRSGIGNKGPSAVTGNGKDGSNVLVVRQQREGINESVTADVAHVLRGKTTAQLVALQSSIESKIRDKPEGTDIPYWESLLSQLKGQMARSRLRDRHQENLKKKLEVLKAEQGVTGGDQQRDASQDEAGVGQHSPEAGPSRESEIATRPSQDDASCSGDKQLIKSEDGNTDREEDDERSSNEAEEEDAEVLEYEKCGYSPKLISVDNLEPGTLITTEEEDTVRLEYARAKGGIANEANNASSTLSSSEDLALAREAARGMTQDEAVFSVESPLETQHHVWSDKYRPRKPRYFNRVHTGFEWNKYNQTHYDMDNPPPKIVQGYKFNIFYPDLIDKNSTPQYLLTICPDNSEFSILRFRAGPPYEDIAFKIVNREWEYSYKRGFRCQFHNNIFQLWFHFKRYRYRR